MPRKYVKKKLYGTKELADMVGLQPATITHYAKQGLIKSRKVGKSYVFTQEQIDAWQKKRVVREERTKNYLDSLSICPTCGTKFVPQDKNKVFEVNLCDDCVGKYETQEQIILAIKENAKETSKDLYDCICMVEEYAKTHTREEFEKLLERLQEIKKES